MNMMRLSKQSNSSEVRYYDDLVSGLLRHTLQREGAQSNQLDQSDQRWIQKNAPQLSHWRNPGSIILTLDTAKRLDRIPDTVSAIQANWEVVPALTLDSSSAKKAYLGIEVADDPALHFDEMEGLHTDAMTIKIFALLRRHTVRDLIMISPSLSYNPTCLILTAAGRDIEECLAQMAAVFVYDAGFVDTDRIAHWFHIVWRSLEEEGREGDSSLLSLIERFVFENMLTLSEGIPLPDKKPKVTMPSDLDEKFQSLLSRRSLK